MWILCDYCATIMWLLLLCYHYMTLWSYDVTTMLLLCDYYVTTMQLANTMGLLCYYFVMFCWIFNTNTNTRHFTWSNILSFFYFKIDQADGDDGDCWCLGQMLHVNIYTFKGSTVKVKLWLQRLSSRSFGDGDEVIGEIPNHGESPLVMDIGDEDVKVKSM